MKRILCRLLFSSLILFVAAPAAWAVDQTTVDWIATTSGRLKMQDNVTFLTNGDDATAGDGAILQLGYYDAATSENNFAGNWVPLTGEGSLNPSFDTTIGDTGGFVDGRFSLSTTFIVGTHQLPVGNPILSIRFYNSTALNTATFFGAVSNDAWVWATPTVAPPGSSVGPLTISNPNAALEWQGGGAGYFTNIAIPEPSAALLIVCAAGMFGGARRRGSR